MSARPQTEGVLPPLIDVPARSSTTGATCAKKQLPTWSKLSQSVRKYLPLALDRSPAWSTMFYATDTTRISKLRSSSFTYSLILLQFTTGPPECDIPRRCLHNRRVSPSHTSVPHHSFSTTKTDASQHQPSLFTILSDLPSLNLQPLLFHGTHFVIPRRTPHGISESLHDTPRPAQSFDSPFPFLRHPSRSRFTTPSFHIFF